MELLLMIIAFVAFSVISDAIEGQKKKRKNQEIPPREQPKIKARMEAETRERKRKIDVLIPPIKGAPSAEWSMNGQQERRVPEVKPQYVAVPRQAKLPIVEMIPAIVENNITLKQADIHSNVLLHAVAYAQILQPPKAYQYMATRSCRGDWNNNK